GARRCARAPPARATAREAQGRLQPADGRLAPGRARAAPRLAPLAGAGRGAGPLPSGGRRAAGRDAAERAARRLAPRLEPDRARAVAPGVRLERVAEERRDALQLSVERLAGGGVEAGQDEAPAQ